MYNKFCKGENMKSWEIGYGKSLHLKRECRITENLLETYINDKKHYAELYAELEDHFKSCKKCSKVKDKLDLIENLRNCTVEIIHPIKLI